MRKLFGLKARRSYPTKITIDLNTQCNASCIICPYPKLRNKLKHGVMEWKLYRKIIDEFASICYANRIMGEVSYCNMSEPTLLPDLPEFARYARDKGCFTIYFNTNGSRLTPKIVNELVNNKIFPAIHLNIMSFSKKKYEKTMGLDFDILMNNLEYLVSKYPHGLIDAGFFTPLMSDKEIEMARNFFKNTRVTLHLSDHISDRASNIDLPEDVSSFQSCNKLRSFGCSSNKPVYRMHISFDGTVYLCDQDMSMDTNFGNVKDNTIVEIWNGEPAMSLLRVIYGQVLSDDLETIPCFKCTECIDNDQVNLLNSPRDYQCRKLFGPVKRWIVKKGWVVVKKRGRLGLR